MLILAHYPTDQVRGLRHPSGAPPRSAHLHTIHDKGLPAAQEVPGTEERDNLRLRLPRDVPSGTGEGVGDVLEGAR